MRNKRDVFSLLMTDPAFGLAVLLFTLAVVRLVLGVVVWVEDEAAVLVDAVVVEEVLLSEDFVVESVAFVTSRVVVDVVVESVVVTVSFDDVEFESNEWHTGNNK